MRAGTRARHPMKSSPILLKCSFSCELALGRLLLTEHVPPALRRMALSETRTMPSVESTAVRRLA
jgi:hypothetical protein